MKKILLCIVLSLSMFFSMLLPVAASEVGIENTDKQEAQTEAEDIVRSSGSDDNVDPYLIITVYRGSERLEGANTIRELTTYSEFRVDAFLVDKNQRTNVTEQCKWSSSAPSSVEITCNQIISKDILIQEYGIKTFDVNNNITTIKANYKGVHIAEFPIRVVDLKLSSQKEMLEYAALSLLGDTDFSEAQQFKLVGQMLKDGDTLRDRDTFISKNKKQGATFASFYSANISEWAYIDQARLIDGFVGTIFKNPKTGDYVISYRGTEPEKWNGIPDFFADICLGMGKGAMQLSSALDFYDQMKARYGSSITLTGHSLGGGLANYVSVLRGVPAYTFNAPSTMVSAIVSEPQAFAENFRGLDDGLRMDFTNPKDWVGNTGVGDNESSTLTSNISAGLFVVGGKIDRTSFLVDSSSSNGKDMLPTLYHGFCQMLSYNMEKQSVAMQIRNHANPTSYSFTLRGRHYVLGSKSNDNNLYYISGDARVFAGSGDDNIQVSSRRSLSFSPDQICGGPGDDIISGSISNQNYLYTNGDGCDTIYDAAGKDAIHLYGYEPSAVNWREMEDASGVKFYEILADGQRIMKVQQNGSGSYSLYVGEIEAGVLKRTNQITREYTVACPVNMCIYDASDNLVCVLKDGEPMEELLSYGHFTVEKQGEEYVKSAILFEEGYTVKLLGIGEGTMQYSYAINDGDTVKTMTMENIPVQEGASYTTSKDFSEEILTGDLDGDGSIDYNGVYIAPQTVSLNTQQTELSVGDTLSLQAVVAPTGASQHVVWSSSDPEVAFVDENGLVTAVGAGSTEITVACASESDIQSVCQINVQEQTISLKEADASVLEADYSYTGEAIEPDLVVRYHNMELREGLHYTVEFEDNVFPGTASVTVTGIGSFSDTLDLNFEIQPVPDITVEQKVEQLAAECRESGAETEYDIALWFHDWLIDHADYDHTLTEYGADGVLLKGTGVCQSYTLAYQTLLDRAGIENIVVTAPEMDHAWNIVKINGSWTHIDCTWDDPNYGGCENHQYFGLSDEDMERDHIWDHSKYPECFTVKRDLSQTIPAEPYSLMDAVEGIDFALIDASGNILTRQDFAEGNTLLIFGRPVCGNTMGFINEILPWKDMLKENHLNVVVVFEDAEQVAENADQLPFPCVYEADSGYGRWKFDERIGLEGSYIYPQLVLQNPQGYAFYYSTGYVYEPERVLATALQQLPQTEEIAAIPCYFYTDETTLKEGIQNALKNHNTTIRLCRKGSAEVSSDDLALAVDLMNQYAGQYGGAWTSYSIFGNTIEFTAEYQGDSFHTHTWDSGTVTIPATCTAKGKKSFVCVECGAVKEETTAKADHSYQTIVVKATTSKNGSIVKRCEVCQAQKDKKIIYYPQKITLAKSSYTYTGKAVKPAVTVKGSDGKTIAASNYTVSYAKGRKTAGSYKVTVIFKKNYKGTVIKRFQIVPKGTRISKLSAASKGFKITWKKQKTQTSGYQIQYATDKKFRKAVTKTINKNTTVSAVYKKLKAKTTYYVRIRTYKTVSGKKYYSSWSGIKTVKTRK